MPWFTKKPRAIRPAENVGDVFETGMEGREFESGEYVSCPVQGVMVSLDICASGAGGKPCAYFERVKELDRGRNRPSRRAVICKAPRRRAVFKIVRGEK